MVITVHSSHVLHAPAFILHLSRAGRLVTREYTPLLQLTSILAVVISKSDWILKRVSEWPETEEQILEAALTMTVCCPAQMLS